MRLALSARETWAAWAMLLPAVTGLVLFYGWPAVRAVQISFTDWNLLRPARDVGWANYARLLDDDRFWHGLQLSLGYVLLNIPLQTVLGLALAVAMDRLTRSLFVKAVVLLPYLLSNVLVALVLTGMVHYSKLNTEAFLAAAFKERGLNWVGGLIAFSALIATASVLLVFTIGQPRIWMSMSRDGLLPQKFSQVHPKYKTPGFATLMTGLLVGIPVLFLDANLVVDMCSIGTLFAFILVCGGVIILQERDKQNATDNHLATPKFKTPYINGQFIVPVLLIIGLVLFFKDPANVESTFPFDKGFSEWKHQIPFWIFIFVSIYIAVKTFIKKWSLIPVLGFLSCSMLVSTLGVVNWMRFLIWMAIGFVIYFSYGIKHSKLK